MSSQLSLSAEYVSFRSNIPLRKIAVDTSEKGWKVYDSGPKTITCPLVCLPPVCGSADMFYKQVLGLSAKGFRVISVEHPPYWSINDWCAGFKKLLEHLELKTVHLFGASLGGFLAQSFTEFTANCPCVASIILCNSFCDTSVFNHSDKSSIFWMLPSVILRKMLMVNLPMAHHDKRIIDSVDFMVDKIDSLSQQDLASRLTLNCIRSKVSAKPMTGSVTVIYVYDECVLPHSVLETLRESYPEAKLALLKTGGNFPYLSRSEEVNLYLQVHLRHFNETEFRACL